LALAGTHPINRLSLQLHHRGRGERPTRSACLLLDGDEVASLDATIDLLLHILDARLSERSLQRIPQDRPFVHDGLALQIAIACERHGSSREA